MGIIMRKFHLFLTIFISIFSPFSPQGQGPYQKELKKIEVDIKDVQKRVNEKMGKIALFCFRLEG